MLILLRINGHRLSLGQHQRYESTMRVADGSLSFEDVARLLRDVLA